MHVKGLLQNTCKDLFRRFVAEGQKETTKKNPKQVSLSLGALEGRNQNDVAGGKKRRLCTFSKRSTEIHGKRRLMTRA